MGDGVKRNLLQVDGPLLPALDNHLNIAADEVSTVGNAETVARDQIGQFSQIVLVEVAAPFIVRILLTYWGEAIKVRTADQQLKDIPDPRHIRCRNN